MTNRREKASERRLLVTGAGGIIGRDLVLELRRRAGAEAVVATYHLSPLPADIADGGPSAALDVSDRRGVMDVANKHRITTVYHLAAVLSGVAEEHLDVAWNANVRGLYNVLDTAKELRMKQVFVPSSIAVFGETTPKVRTPQDTVLHPATFYGVSKRFGELLGDYYASRYGLDVRGLRYPGIVSTRSTPGSRVISRMAMKRGVPTIVKGSMDYVLGMFYAALEKRDYTCFLRPETILPLMYVRDCVKATIDLMDASVDRLEHHCDFNLRGMEFSAGGLAEEIKKHVPEFRCSFEPDDRQELADALARTIDETAAILEWNWKPDYDLPLMTTEILQTLRCRAAEHCEAALWVRRPQ